MQIINTVDEMRAWSEAHFDKPIAAVYTMGALHAGHIELMKYARTWIREDNSRDCYVVASIFINPTQFSSEEDLTKYPRTLSADLAECETAGADAVFVPTADQMYPEGIENVQMLDAGELKHLYEGVSRAGHFDGVVTVVNKLLSVTKPQFAFFGEKDFQQFTVLKNFVAREKLPVRIVGVPTVRADDGLALSSRNIRLSAHSREIAAHIPIALDIVQQAANQGVEINLALESARKYLAQFKEIELDYLVVTSEEMEEAPDSGSARVLLAAVIDGIRLLDNKPIQIRKP